MADELPLRLHVGILRTLERLGVRYVVIGAFAGTSYGITRATFDVDIVVELDEEHVEALVSAYPPPRYYADPEQMRDSVRRGILFNIIDSTEGTKADLIPVTMAPGYEWALEHRIRRAVPLSPDQGFDAWFARPEDVIVGKLMAWQEGRSLKHESDIRDILVAMRLGTEAELSASFDLGYLERWVARLGGEVPGLWESLKRAAGMA